MAVYGSPQRGTILKEGYLTQENTFKSDTRKWWVLENSPGPLFSRYKDSTKVTLEKQIQGWEIDKQKHDNYISIKSGRKITHLRADSKQQRDEWYGAILRSLGRADDGEVAPVLRRRAGTDPSPARPPIHRGGRHVQGPQSGPSLDHVFHKELRNPPPSQPRLDTVREDADDGDLAKVTQDYQCCVRNHVIGCNNEGKNMVDVDVVYENVHFVRSEEEYLAAIAHNRARLARAENLYTIHHGVAALQSVQDESIYETSIVGENPAGLNDLNPPLRAAALPVGDFQPNIPAEGYSNSSSSERNSQASIEDNADDQAVVPGATAERRAPPPVPVHTGARLRERTRKLKEDQRQLHIERTFSKASLVGERVKVKLMEKKDGIWVIGLEEGGMRLKSALKVGDQLIKVNKQGLPSAQYARDTIRSTDEDQVTLVLKRIPHGFVCIITRPSPHDDLGITLAGNEITNVIPNGLASVGGDLRPQTTGVSGRMCNWAVTEINAQSVHLSATADEISATLDRAGTEVALIVQPVDFIQMMRDNMAGEVSPSRKS